MLNKKKLIEYFENVIKSDSKLKIGTEHEKFILCKSPLSSLTYYKENGIRDIFHSLIQLGWKPIYEGRYKTIIGLKNNLQTISLEPSGQI